MLGSSHAHVSGAVNPKRWFRAETTATRREEHGGEVVRLATFTARVMGVVDWRIAMLWDSEECACLR